MANVVPPYYFEEFLQPVSRKEPTPRERALGFTVKDLEWLHTLYRATDAARQDSALQGYPMKVERLLINLAGEPAMPIPGAFMMSPTPDARKAVLYTPYGGLELLDNPAVLISNVEERLRNARQRTDLLQFLSIGERDALPADASLTVTAAAIPGAVMEDQEHSIAAGQQKNVAAMLNELRNLPSLRGMLDTLLVIMARPYFPGLNPRDTRVSFFSRASAEEDSRRVSSEPLRDALLKFYIKHAWPLDQTHTFSNIAHDTTAFTQEQLDEDQQRWDSVVEHTSGILSTLLNSLLQTYWNEDFNDGQSRRQFFARVMSDKFRVDLLFKHQNMILSAEESQTLRTLLLPDQAARNALASQLSIEKVRIHAPFQHHVDLASTLMISNSHAYLYTQSRGVQVLANLKDLNDTLLTMLKTTGHEDEPLNFLSLEERRIFIAMDHLQVTGQPVSGDVFEEMVEDVITKQFDNLEHALGLYRRSAGGIDLAALLDNALDVRAMLDSRLLELQADGRWSVHPISSGDGRASTVQAEKAKLHLQRLQAIETAVALARDQHPPQTNTLKNLSHAMLQGLSGEAELRRLDKSLSPQSLALLGSVLNADSMTRLTRHGLNGFIPDAFGLALKVGADTVAHALANCFVLTERGGLDPDHSGAALLWTPRCGYEAFTSFEALRAVLEQRLQDPLKRLPLIENLPISKRVPHQPFELGPLQRIDDQLLHNRQQTCSALIRDPIDPVLSKRLSATHLQRYRDNVARRTPSTNLERAIGMARAMINQQALPAWLGMARPHEQILHAELLEQYRLSAPDERDYLHSITPMREHVLSTLSSLLNARFPEQAINPDDILIPGRIDLEGNTQSLTDFALRHLPELHAEDIRPRSRTAGPLPTALDGNAVVQLVRQLDLKSLYQQRLTTQLAGQTEQTRTRRQLFCRQLPWQLLQYAHEQMLEERLSATAWSYIRQVFDMPDALARAAVPGVTAIIRPLELVATPGAALVKALGCYLIGPQSDASSPLVLYAPYSPKHVLKEYASEAALLDEFNLPGALQEWVVGLLETKHQATYRNLLRQQTSEIRLGASAIGGNLLNRLFHDNREMLIRMLACQFSQSGQSKWGAISNLLINEIPKGLQFLAGKLTYPLVVWRSYKLFETSAEDLQQHRWQHALKTFALGVAELASLRTELDKLIPQAPSPEEQVTLEQWLQTSAPAAASLADLDLTAPERTHLQTFENHDMALGNLEQSTLSNVYSDAATTQNFVPLAGKVYSVKEAGERWRLSNAEHVGPYVQCNAQKEWTLDLDRHHPRYGKTLSRYADRLATRSAVRKAINIEAVGMREIAALSSWKAQCIDEALNVATYYTVTCKRNLVHFTTRRDPDSRLGGFFSELFGIVTLTPEQVQRIERRVDEVLDELVNHTLIGPDSKRFVSGTHRYSPQNTFAFILPDDKEQKIYLLARFFDPQMDIYQNRLNTPFDLSAHARATTLIHEITHLKSLTEDLAYLDSMRPFQDLINVNIKGAKLLQTDLTDLRETALSTLTPATMLFKTWDEFTQAWEDFGSDISTAELKDKVLSTTGAQTLDDARKVFMSDADKRIDTILANADSVTYLISHLGRELDAGA